MSALMSERPTPITPLRKQREAPSSQVGVERESTLSLLLTGYLPLILATLIIALPLLWMMLGSLKTSGEVVSRDIVWLPGSPTLDAYRTASEKVDFPRLFLNSTIVTVIGRIWWSPRGTASPSASARSWGGKGSLRANSL